MDRFLRAFNGELINLSKVEDIRVEQKKVLESNDEAESYGVFACWNDGNHWHRLTEYYEDSAEIEHILDGIAQRINNVHLVVIDCKPIEGGFNVEGSNAAALAASRLFPGC